MAGDTEKAEWHPSPRVRAFIAAYRRTASVTRAAAAAKIDRHAHYRLLERSAAYRTMFAAAAEEAAQTLEDEAVRRAVEGVSRPVMYHGKPVLVPVNPKKLRGKKKPLLEHERSDTLLLALLRAKKPAEYKDRVEHDVAPELTRKFEGSMQDLLALYRELTVQGKAA
jgi:hypothetical protein